MACAGRRAVSLWGRTPVCKLQQLAGPRLGAMQNPEQRRPKEQGHERKMPDRSRAAYSQDCAATTMEILTPVYGLMYTYCLHY